MGSSGSNSDPIQIVPRRFPRPAGGERDLTLPFPSPPARCRRRSRSPGPDGRPPLETFEGEEGGRGNPRRFVWPPKARDIDRLSERFPCIPAPASLGLVMSLTLCESIASILPILIASAPRLMSSPNPLAENLTAERRELGLRLTLNRRRWERRGSAGDPHGSIAEGNPDSESCGQLWLLLLSLSLALLIASSSDLGLRLELPRRVRRRGRYRVLFSPGVEFWVCLLYTSPSPRD